MTAAPFSAVFWDVDGTIADASRGILPRLAATLASFGTTPPPERELRHWIGPPLEWSFHNLGGLSVADAAEAVARYRALAAAEGYATSVDIYPGVAHVLRAVAAAGIPQATASTKPQNQVEAILQHYDLAQYFTVIEGATVEPGVIDTKADVLRRALTKAADRGADVSRPVLIGDRHHDVEGGAELGVPVIFNTWGFGESAEAEGAIATVAEPGDLVLLLLGSARP